MNITEAELSGASHVVILGAGASIASCIRDPEMNGKQLPSMNDLAKVVGLNDLLDKFPAEFITNNFESTYSNIAEQFPDSPYLKEMNDRIYQYFSSLQLPNKPTIYDYLVMSLRGKDVIATFNWDPFLIQAWVRNSQHGSNPHLLFLHGNVAIGYNEVNNRCGWANSTLKSTGEHFAPTQLLFPIKHKDYNKDCFIKKQWEHLQMRLTKEKCNTHYVTIFGYSAPVSDVEALSMMKQAWGNIYERNLEQFEFIDIREEDDVLDSWSDFVHTHHYDYCDDFFKSSLARYPRRTAEAYWCQNFFSNVEEAFVDENLVPNNFQTFEEMWNWYQPMIEKEKENEK